MALATVVAVAECGGSGNPHSIHISEGSFHGTWPFTVSIGVLTCHHPPATGAVTFTADGTTYGINGTALDSGYPDCQADLAQARAPAHSGRARLGR